MISREAQAQAELDSDIAAAEAMLEQLEAEAGSPSSPRATKLIARMYAPVSEYIKEHQDTTTRGSGAKYRNWIRALPAETVAVIALNTIIGRLQSTQYRIDLQQKNTLPVLARQIADRLVLEVRIREAEKVNPLYMKRVHEQIETHHTKSERHIRGVYHNAYARVVGDYVTLEGLSDIDMLQIGKFGVDACVQAGLIELVKGTGKSGKLYVFQFTPEIQEYLFSFDSTDVRGVVNIEASSMRCPPDTWTTLIDGGYITARRKSLRPLLSVSSMRRSVRRDVMEDFTAEKMPMVFKAGNYLQSIAYEVHTPTLEAISKLWFSGGGVLGVPTKSMPAKPEFPFPEDWDKGSATPEEMEVFTRWKLATSIYYTSMVKWGSRTREIATFLRRADYKGPLWFPVFTDSRGRWYYRGVPNPQGTDLSKAVLHFHEKKPLGKRGVFWLKVAIANGYGYDKVRFHERAQWTDDNWKLIQTALEAPGDHPDVWGNDSPWCMFSAAYELNQAYLSGDPESYCTGIPVHMDATCSGLQHFSAMLRDPVGGQYVNLFDVDFSGPKQDIYSRVATTALESIRQDCLSKDTDEAAIAQWWASQGIPRALAKKPVMTYCYSATLRGATDFVGEYLVAEGIKVPEHIGTIQAAGYLGKKLFYGIAATVPSAEAAMRWLRAVASSKANGERMVWTTPSGFKVQHDYQDYNEVRICVRSCGIKQVLMRDYTDGTRKASMGTAISPNFVHALDATHVTLTAGSMQDAGLSMVSIHDSFGTHPSDVDAMHKIIREQFIKMYEVDVLSNFLWEVDGLGAVPSRGNLDLSKVASSEFFFC